MHCEQLPLKILLNVFDESGQARAPQAVLPSFCLFSTQVCWLQRSRSGSGSPLRVSSALSESLMLGLSSSEELDVLSIDAGDIEDSPPLSPAHEEPLEVVTRAVNKLNIDWPVEKQETQRKSKLDECFLQIRAPPPHWGLPFFPDLYTEVSRSWKRHF